MAKSWLDQYMHHTRDWESPAKFHFWTAVTCVAHAMGRRVWLNRAGAFATFPASMMTLLIGPSGVRKTTAIQQGTKLLEAARLKADDPACINIMADRMSTESLFDDLIPRAENDARLDPEQVDCVGLLAMGEMAATFGNASYMDGLSTHLMNLHDAKVSTYDPKTRSFAPYFYSMSFKKDGLERRRLRNPCLGMLAGTTPTDLGETLPVQVRTNGFLARVIPVWATDSGRPFNALIGEPGDSHVITELVDGLTAIAGLSGEARPTDEAIDYLTEWWHATAMERAQEPNLVLQAFYMRMQDHVHRTAMVFAAVDAVARGVRGHTTLPMTEGHYRRAVSVVTDCARHVPECYAALQIKSAARGIREYILHRLADRRKNNPKTKGWYEWIPFIKLANQRSNREWKAAQIAEELRGLMEGGVIEWQRTGGQNRFRLIERKAGPWSGRPATVDRAFVDGVQRQLAEEYDEVEDEWAEEYAEMAAEQRRRDRGDEDDQ